MFFFFHYESPHHFSFWNSSPVPTSPSVLTVLCFQSMHNSAWVVLFPPMTSAQYKLSCLSCFSVCHHILNRTSSLLFFCFEENILSIYHSKSDFHTGSLTPIQISLSWFLMHRYMPARDKYLLCEKEMCYIAFWSTCMVYLLLKKAKLLNSCCCNLE